MSRIRIISGSAGGLYIQSPKKFTSRPTQERVREALFSSIAPRLPNATFLDLYAGSGSVGIEALSRGAASATFVELDRRFCKTIQNNLAQCHLQADVLSREVTQFLASPPLKTYDLIFADPPYDQKVPLLDQLPLTPDLHRHLSPGGLLIWEHDSHSIWQHPQGLTIGKVKKIGETRLSFLHATS